MIRRDMFVREVKDALVNLYDPIHLQTHPLVELLALQSSPGETAGESLRKLLWSTIESLRPAVSIPLMRPEWLNYRLLWLHYVQSFSQQKVCGELGLSQRSFYRRQREALAAVASILWEKQLREERADEGAEDTRGEEDARQGPDLLPHELARDEALRLAHQARRQAVDLCAILDGAVKTLLPLAEQRGIRLRIDCPPSLPVAYGDPALFHQIILNVLTEGFELISGRTLMLAVRLGENETHWQLLGLDASKAPEQDVEQLVGLMVSRALLDVYGGRLWLERGEQAGFSLAFTVPFAKPMTILIIDDDINTVALYRRYLQGQQYIVRSARNRQEVSVQLGEAKPDVILLDVLMPQEDGWKLLQRLKTLPETESVPVVICSVLSQPGLALSLGAAKVLQKPIEERVLLETVQETLAGR